MTRHTICGLGLWAATLGLGSGCDNQLAGEHRLTSLRMLLRSPTESELGSPSNTISPATLKFDVEALAKRRPRKKGPP